MRKTRLAAASVGAALFCDDRQTGKHTVTVLSALRVAGLATVVGLRGFIGLALIRERGRPHDSG